MSRNSAPRLLPLWLAGAALLAAAACTAQDADWAELRAGMVEEQIKARGIKDERVLKAMAKVPRHEFVPTEERADAYRDGPLPIGHGQTISQPYVVALMTEEAKPRPEHRVLEIGTGSGYQAAVLAELVKEVYTIELVPALAQQAGERLERLGYRNVHTRAGDGYKGWPEAAPFDAVVVTCGADHVPEPLVKQLTSRAGCSSSRSARRRPSSPCLRSRRAPTAGGRRATSARSGSCRSGGRGRGRGSERRSVVYRNASPRPEQFRHRCSPPEIE
jgi:protein-L-isoaspartate(D-aspartate) O-methyltransferase